LFTGHYSFSFAGRALAGTDAGKNNEKRIPLWLLFLAVQWIDVMWSIFVLLGIEKVRIVPGFTASNALDLYYMPYTHSLLGVLCWSVLAYVVCQLFPQLRGMRTGLIVAAAVFSHWILDLIVHIPDLALYDSVGKTTFDKSLNCLRPRGLMALFGSSSGAVPPMDPQTLNAKGSIFLTRPTLAHHVLTRDELLWRAGDVLNGVASGALRLRIDRTYPLAQVAEAHRALESRATTGKLLIKI
jgi:hypothetical protein